MSQGWPEHGQLGLLLHGSDAVAEERDRGGRFFFGLGGGEGGLGLGFRAWVWALAFWGVESLELRVEGRAEDMFHNIPTPKCKTPKPKP